MSSITDSTLNVKYTIVPTIVHIRRLTLDVDIYTMSEKEFLTYIKVGFVNNDVDKVLTIIGNRIFVNYNIMKPVLLATTLGCKLNKTDIVDIIYDKYILIYRVMDWHNSLTMNIVKGYMSGKNSNTDECIKYIGKLNDIKRINMEGVIKTDNDKVFEHIISIGNVMDAIYGVKYLVITDTLQTGNVKIFSYMISLIYENTKDMRYSEKIFYNSVSRLFNSLPYTGEHEQNLHKMLDVVREYIPNITRNILYGICQSCKVKGLGVIGLCYSWIHLLDSSVGFICWIHLLDSSVCIK